MGHNRIENNINILQPSRCSRETALRDSCPVFSRWKQQFRKQWNPEDSYVILNDLHLLYHDSLSLTATVVTLTAILQIQSKRVLTSLHFRKETL